MSTKQRITLLTGAMVTMSVAIALLIQVGLPNRTAMTDRTSRGQLPVAPEEGAMAPHFQGETLDGRLINLESLRGKPVLVNFWATWCTPCRVEMPELQTLYIKHRENGLHVLAVNLGEDRETIQESWAGAMGLAFDIVLDQNQEVAALYQLRGQPTTYFIAPSGIIDKIFYGPTSETTLVSVLESYLTG